ncbi:MAG: Phospholipase D/competence protein ComEA helix-hairpin-helix domain protein [Parcubacteria group bacterium GW2011_GWC1_43_11b]|uniref:PKD domain-containing protein n=2 Tax=Candidatus Vogeliibacteriota TaxID=1817922 RepID=A0A1G2QDL5_9BACT|nr:MAG: PKD domain containing protein [Parcubacteria group bacterium GW2011_GWB1_42_9]KKS89613.1 MAG: Phospholipase D/competence protein ComEA helix-hairpin-helix domain protein [Parcubacteria group bacterium GW2011_GWC1_43_11b]KKT10064.1 MAG: PKD domain containing protein [Parcubacteria group bacterium GW2011_GWA1_43_21]OHA58051.1 MAG: hypothetical protein A2370_01660 [Candidatus Vogelbacteria bacterium RIFOXYB1_FULL_42_16]OHA58320.1 MAG: hypothetical protein A2607_00335 [Candidatus Vogelbacte
MFGKIFNTTVFRKKSVVIFGLGLVLLGWPILTLATVEKIVFTTNPQTVSPGQMSSEITIQAQNNEGVSEKVTETMDLVFTSSSATGEFLNSTGDPVQKYMSKNSTNRNFYFRDSVLGEQTITVTATGRDSGQTFLASQKIIIGETVNEESKATSTDDSSSTTPTTSNSGGGLGSVSAHSAQTDLSDSEESMPAIGAGRKRLASTGAPMAFRVEKSKSAQNSAGRFVWSFGDGSSAEGEKIEHTYQFAGEYNVVVNGYFGANQSVARTKVIVEDAKVTISEVNLSLGFVALQNDNKKEINLGGWNLKGSVDYVLPADTIIDAGKNIKIPLNLIAGTSTVSGLVLSTPDDRLVDSWGVAVGLNGDITVEEVENKLAILKSQLALLRVSSGQNLAPQFLAENIAPDHQTTTADRIILKSKLSWWQKLIKIGR